MSYSAEFIDSWPVHGPFMAHPLLRLLTLALHDLMLLLYLQ